MLEMKRVTLKHVSEAAGVSVQTVSHILGSRYRSLYNPETCEKVLDVARSMGYRPNAAARSMLAQRSHIIGVLVPIVREGWFFQLDVFETMLGMNERLSSEGYVTSVIPVGDLQSGGGASRAFQEQMLDGVVVIGWVPDDVTNFVEKVAPTTIWCDTNIDRPTGCVRRDEAAAGRVTAEQVLALGYKRIVWLTYPISPDHYSGVDRFREISRVAEKRRVPVEVVRVSSSALVDESDKLAALFEPTTVFLTENHHFAQALANIASRLGRMPCKNFGLASCDHSRERSTVFPQLSRLVIDRKEIGVRTAEMLLNTMAQSKPQPSQLISGNWFSGETLRRVD